MSKVGSSELTKSWVFIDSNQDNQLKDTSGVQEITENEPHGDSDTDSISVISESGCSYKTDEEELTQQGVREEENETIEEKLEKEPEVVKELEPKIIKEPEIAKEPELVELLEPPCIVTYEENKGIEKLLYFATSAVCAIILVAFSIAVQHYFQGASDLNTFEPDKQSVFSHVQNIKNEPLSTFSPKRKTQLKLQELENKISKMQEDNEFHDKVTTPIEDNDLRGEENLKSNYKLNKNKNPASKCNKGNCDVSEKHSKIHEREKRKPAEIEKNDENTQNEPLDENTNTDKTYIKKVKELKVKEDYLKQKEKFLIEKEHDLMRKEIKLGKEKEKQHPKHKHDKKILHKKGRDAREDSSEEEEPGERKDKFKSKEYSKRYVNKNNKKYVYKEEKKQFPTQKRFKFSEDHNKKHNISGQWYINLHEARDNMRQRKRASFKKNKAHWYFQWMVDRARLRVK